MSVLVPDLDPETDLQLSAIEEADMVSEWASATTPEWVRCLGAIWEAFDQRDDLYESYVGALKAMLAETGLEDLGVVVRQLRERDYNLAAEAAVRVGNGTFRRSNDKIAEIRALAETDASAAIDAALAFHRELAADPKSLAETPPGIAIVELALDLLLPVKDRRALAVQQSLLDAKLALWGECPSVWLERHNLGTIYAQLGDRDLARDLITKARDALRAHFGDDNEHVAMCMRSLARLAAR